MNSSRKYDAILIDTSIYDGNGLRLEKGLLGKLHQFKNSPIIFLLPDVIHGEVKTHLEQKIRTLRGALEKSINEAGEHLFFDGNTLNEAKELLLESNEIERLAERRLDSFVKNTGALVLECGEHLSVSELLKQYFKNAAPFSETGKKKNEFPDAIVLMAVDDWAKKSGKFVIAVAKDDDWSRYCELSSNIDCISELSDGLAIFNKENAHFEFLSKLESALNEDRAQTFLDLVAARLEVELDGFTPDQDAESFLHWEPEGSNGWFKSFYLTSHDLKIIESDEEYIVVECKAAITIEAEGDFSLSVHDSIDDDYLHIDSVTARVEQEFESELLISITGNLTGPIEELDVEQVDIVSPIKRVHFGTLEPDFGDNE